MHVETERYQRHSDGDRQREDRDRRETERHSRETETDREREDTEDDI